MGLIAVITSTLKGRNKDGSNRTKDGQDHTASRLVPFMAKADFEKAPGKALDAWIKDLESFDASRTLDGKDATGAAVSKTGLPYKSFGTDTAFSAAELYAVIWRGLSLAHQPEIAAKLAEKYEIPGEAGGGRKARGLKGVAGAGETL